MTSSADEVLVPLGAPLGVNAFYCQHAEILELKVKVQGKFASLSRELHVKASDGAPLYTMRQKKAAIRYKFKAFRESEPAKTKGHDDPIFTATAKGGFGKNTFDLTVTFENDCDAGKEQTLSLKTGVMKEVSEIIDADGRTIAHINRSVSAVKRIALTESYLLRIVPGFDASLALLVMLCLHIQSVDWKAATYA